MLRAPWTFVFVAMAVMAAVGQAADGSRSYLEWTRQQAEAVGRSMRAEGRVGGVWAFRGIKTERSLNYKLRATLMTPDVIRAAARLAQLSSSLTAEETAALVNDAERAGGLVVMFEIDPNEGSGVIPLDLVALLRPKDARDDSGVRGTLAPSLRDVRALGGVFRRDYAYEQLWAVFRLDEEAAKVAIGPEVRELEFVVRIYDKEGRVSWPVSESLRVRH
jgi:hypothetical protein